MNDISGERFASSAIRRCFGDTCIELLRIRVVLSYGSMFRCLASLGRVRLGVVPRFGQYYQDTMTS